MAQANTRLQAVRAALEQYQLDGLLVSSADNRRYLSGFHGTAGWLLITANRQFIMVDSRYWTQAEQQAPDWQLVRQDGRHPQAFPPLLAEAGVKRIGIESAHITLDQYTSLFQPMSEYQFVPIKGLVESLRAVKSPAEVASIRQAIQVAEAALTETLAQVRPGMTEMQMALLLESAMKRGGASEGISFPLIVAGGQNGALPHGRATQAPLVAGQPIVIDWGCRMPGGYVSDLTRTVVLGEPANPDLFWPVYHTVLEANRAACAGIKAGMNGIDADAIARNVIDKRGYGELFGHSLGHGIGLEVHEAPLLGPRSKDTLVAGNIVTVEPGIYLPGRIGVRIEDDIVITADGVEVLSHFTTDPIVPIL